MTRMMYAGFAFIILSSFATFLIIGSLFYRIIHKDEDIGRDLASICTTSGLTLILTVIEMALCRSDAETHRHRRQVVFGQDNQDPDRIQMNIRLLRWLKLLRTVFPCAWKVISLIYISLCVALYFVMKSMVITAALLGIPVFLMILFGRCLVPSMIRSLEIIAGNATDDGDDSHTL